MLSRIEDLTKIYSGYLFTSSVQEDINAKYAVIFISDVTESRVLRERPGIYKLPSEPNFNHFVQKGDILIQAKGTPRVILIDADLPDTLASAHFLILRCTQNNILPDYLAWHLSQKPAQQLLVKSQQGQNIPILSKKYLSELEITVPSLVVQEKILNLAKSKDHVISLLQATQKQYELFFDALAIKAMEVPNHE